MNIFPRTSDYLALSQKLSLENRAVRDLTWALLHPKLFNQVPNISPSCFQQEWLDNDLIDWLIALDKKPTLLFEHLREQRATRLGIYFEQLLSFYFSNYPRFTLVAKNLQANDSQRTIGEYDFIVFDHQDQQHYHIEVAIKFYLGMPNLTVEIPKNKATYNWHLWVGPNKKDTLAIKMNHLKNHQLSLSKTAAGQAALVNINLTTEQLAIRLLMTGVLYYPFNQLNTNCNINPPTHHIDHFAKKNFWFTLKQFTNYAQELFVTEQQFIILPRQQWMSSITDNDREVFGLSLLSLSEIINLLNSELTRQDKQYHIACFEPHSQGQWREVQRFFVIP